MTKLTNSKQLQIIDSVRLKYQLPFGLSLSKALHPFTFRQTQCERTSNIIGPNQ